MLRLFSDAGSSSQLHYASQLQSIMFLCLGLGGVILALHAWISRTFPKNPKGSTALKLAAQRRAVAAGAASDGSKPHHRALDLEAAVKGLNYCSLEEQQEAAQRNGAAPPPANGTAALRNNGAALPPQQTAVNAAAAAATETPLAGGNHARNGHVADSTQAGSSNQDAAAEVEQQQAKKKRKKEAMSMKDAWQFLCKSPQIQCLAVMALAQVRLALHCMAALQRAPLNALPASRPTRRNRPEATGCSVCRASPPTCWTWPGSTTCTSWPPPPQPTLRSWATQPCGPALSRVRA